MIRISSKAYKKAGIFGCRLFFFPRIAAPIPLWYNVPDKKRRIRRLNDENGENNGMNEIENVFARRLRRGKVVFGAFYSRELKLDWNYAVYLPAGYDEKDDTKKYPVIYLLHGAYGNCTDFLEKFSTPDMVDELIAQGRLPECIVAFVDGFNAFYLDGPAMKMESAVMNDLIPFIESTYHGMGTKEGRVIGGISMGGFGTARFCLKYPQMFAHAIMLSPAVWHEVVPGKASCAGWGLFTQHLKDDWMACHPEAYLESYAKADSPVNFFIAHGLADVDVLAEDVEMFVDKLRKVAPVVYLPAEGEEHCWPFWKIGLRTGLEYAGKFMLGTDK